MSQQNITSAKTNTQDTNDKYWASDDVHRIALKHPNLYQMNSVPRIDRSHLSYLDEGGVL